MTHASTATLGTFPQRRRLGRHEFLHLARPPVLRLQALRGTLWVTVDGDNDDIEIDAGNSRVFDGRAPVTIGTLGGAAVFCATPLAPPPGRWLRLRAAFGHWFGRRLHGAPR